MRVIAVVSPLGGTGRTTLVAHLATLMARQGQPCLAIDLCTQNRLGRHLGMPEPPEVGWASMAAAGQWWAEGSVENSDRLAVLPFGESSSTTLDAIHNQLHAQPHWLKAQLELLEVPTHCTVLLDTPLWPSPLAHAALRCADTVLVTLEASARSCASLSGVSNLLLEAVTAKTKQGVVVTRFDPRRISQRDALQTLRAHWGERLIPYTLHEDENISRALARSMCVYDFAPQAQSSHDLQGVYQWLMAPQATEIVQP